MEKESKSDGPSNIQDNNLGMKSLDLNNLGSVNKPLVRNKAFVSTKPI